MRFVGKTDLPGDDDLVTWGEIKENFISKSELQDILQKQANLITTKMLQDASVTSDKILDRTLTADKLAFPIVQLHTGVNQLATGSDNAHIWVGSASDMQQIVKTNAVHQDWIYFVDAQAPLSINNV